MERFRKNKENTSGNTCSISNIFKVKKCLFDKNLQKTKTESDSPTSGQQLINPSPVPLDLLREPEDSPYSLFNIKKKRPSFRSKISDSSNNGQIVTTPTIKKFRQKEVSPKEDIRKYLQSCSPVKVAVQKSILNPDLIGDFTKPCTLPVITGRHPDLKTISPETMANLLQGTQSIRFSLIDCRYPYEFSAGHIQTAQNIYIKEDIITTLLSYPKTVEKTESKEVLIFYCEFSSQRGPSMLRQLRSMDRDMNRDCYPFLYYPELYILEGGYRAFYSAHKQLCEPQDYKTMLDMESSQLLAFYKSECKSRNRLSKCLKRVRSNVLF